MGKLPKWGANTYKKRQKRKRNGRHKKRRNKHEKRMKKYQRRTGT